MVGRERVVARGERRPAEIRELVGVELDRQTVRPGGREDAVGFLRGEADPLAERVHGIREARFRDRRHHFVDHEVYVGILPAGIFRRKRVRAEKCRLDVDRKRVSELSRDPELLDFRVGVETVARLDLDRGDAFADQVAESRHGGFAESVVVGLSGGAHGRDDAAAGSRDLLVARAVEPHLELARAAAAEDEMGVAVDQAGRDPAPARVVHRARERVRVARKVRRLAEPCDTPVLDRDGGIADRAVGLAARHHRRQVGADPEPVPLAAVRPLARHDALPGPRAELSTRRAFHGPAICSTFRRMAAPETASRT